MGALKTTSVFKAGRPTYLRFTQFTKDRMVGVECFGITNPGHFLSLAWSESSGTVAAPPKPGMKVQVHNLFDGVLHIVSGEVMDLSTGSKPRIRVRIEENCLAVPLRKHQRHPVLGKVRLGQEGDSKAFCQITPHEMDISLGGFGLTVPDVGLSQGDESEFQLELLSGDTNPAAGEGISYQVTGRAAIRRASKVDNSENVQLGLEFLDLGEETRHSLEHWLTVQDSTHRHG